MSENIEVEIAKNLIERLGLEWSPELEMEAIQELNEYLQKKATELKSKS